MQCKVFTIQCLKCITVCDTQWFHDVRQPGVLELAGTVPSTADHPITTGSALVPLHEQDNVGKTQTG